MKKNNENEKENNEKIVEVAAEKWAEILVAQIEFNKNRNKKVEKKLIKKI